MVVKKDINLGTLVPLAIWLLGATIAGVWWAAAQTAMTERIVDWQIRQDARIDALEQSQTQIIRQNARMEALLNVMREEIHSQGQLILQEIREGAPSGGK